MNTNLFFNPLMASPTARAKRGNKGRRIIVDEFSSEIVVRETMRVYGEVLGQG